MRALLRSSDKSDKQVLNKAVVVVSHIPVTVRPCTIEWNTCARDSNGRSVGSCTFTHHLETWADLSSRILPHPLGSHLEGNVGVLIIS